MHLCCILGSCQKEVAHPVDTHSSGAFNAFDVLHALPLAYDSMLHAFRCFPCVN